MTERNKKNRKKGKVPFEPEEGIPFVDVHCHIPWKKRRKGFIEPEVIYQKFKESYGKFMITSAIDWKSLQSMYKFCKNRDKLYLAVGWAPQTITYSDKQKHTQLFFQWKKWIKDHKQDYIAIGEIGLDFHHAKELEERERQIKYFREIVQTTKGYGKPFVLHVRNAGKNDKDPQRKNHPYNEPTAANKMILQLLEEENIAPKRVMWHCFSGPKGWDKNLTKQGYYVSAVSSGYRSGRWRQNTAQAPIEKIMTETDSPFQHPYKFGGFNTPLNAKFSVAAVAYSHNMDQKQVAEKTIENARKFFKINV